MVVMLLLLALAMIATGGAAVVFGAPIVQVERGWSMVISGSVGASAGFVLLGVALAAARLGRVARELITIRDRLGVQNTTGEMRSAGPISQASRSAAPPLGAGSVSAVRRENETGAGVDVSAVVGQYASGGNSYVMYADGSIHAETPTGEHRFSSLDELRSFVAAGGERSAQR